MPPYAPGFLGPEMLSALSKHRALFIGHGRPPRVRLVFFPIFADGVRRRLAGLLWWPLAFGVANSQWAVADNRPRKTGKSTLSRARVLGAFNFARLASGPPRGTRTPCRPPTVHDVPLGCLRTARFCIEPCPSARPPLAASRPARAGRSARFLPPRPVFRGHCPARVSDHTGMRPPLRSACGNALDARLDAGTFRPWLKTAGRSSK